jgi:hypothetical protein
VKDVHRFAEANAIPVVHLEKSESKEDEARPLIDAAAAEGDDGKMVPITGEHHLADNIAHSCWPGCPTRRRLADWLAKRWRPPGDWLPAPPRRTSCDPQLVTAHFFCEQPLPQASGLLSEVTAEAGDLLALSPAQF